MVGLLMMFCGFTLAEETLQQKLVNTCQKIKDSDIQDAKEAMNCTQNGFIIKEEKLTQGDSKIMGTGYAIVGVENGKCHYKKVNVISFFEYETTKHCYEPISVMQNYGNNRLYYAQKSCNSNGFTGVENTALARDLSILESYCK